MKNKIYFISDVHLGSKYHKDPLLVERKLVNFLNTIKDDAKAIYFLGDIFDYWFEYKNVVPRGFTRFIGTVALLSDAGVEINFFAGNHDVWFSDYIKKETNANIYHHKEILNIMGKTFYLSHGDEECSRHNRKERFLYNIFRSGLCRRLYASLHPRWTVGFAHSCSYKSRVTGEQKKEGRVPHSYVNEYLDIEDNILVKYSKQILKDNPDIDYCIFGHMHIMLDMSLNNDRRIFILGDWIKYFSFVCFDGEKIYMDQFLI